jgi:hypothetical protein
MSKRPSCFKETNVKRAIRGVRAAGLEIGSIEIDKLGNIVIVPATPGEKPTPLAEAAVSE